MTTRAEFVATVRSYCGTPYVRQGRVPGVGMDCPAPLICAAWALGIKPQTFDVTGYTAEPDGHTLQRLCDEHLERIDWADALPADVLLCAFRGGHPRHLGVLTETGERTYWVHANDNARHSKVHEARLVFGPHRMLLTQAYRVPGLA